MIKKLVGIEHYLLKREWQEKARHPLTSFSLDGTKF